MEAALGEKDAGEPFVYRHSVDLWDEVAYWSRKWGDLLQVEWLRSYQELRKDGDSWNMLDWMNHVADKIAEAEYGEEEGVNAPDCYRIQGNNGLNGEKTR